MIRVAVISDTHDYLPHGLAQRMAGADEIWHLGDVCEPETLDPLLALGRPVYVVLGNNESHTLWPLERRLEREGHRFFLTHIPPPRPPLNVEFVLHGHTHVVRDETDETGVRWLNPGCIARAPRATGPTFAWLEIEQGKPPQWRLEKV